MRYRVAAAIAVFTGVLITFNGLAQGTVTGFVVDRNGQPIENVRYRVIGYSPYWSEGHMKHVLESGTGWPSREAGTDPKTDKDGQFAITWPRHPFVEVEFRHPAYGPAFLYNISPTNSPLKLVMDEGKLLKGRVCDENGAFIKHTVLELQMPQPDAWYVERRITDENGEFQFRVSKPPQDRSWMLQYAGKSFTIDYGQIGPGTVVEFRVGVQMKLRAQPGAAPNTAPSHR